jgi:predicted ATP-grasp superfamily ATP-dependent carboligase
MRCIAVRSCQNTTAFSHEQRIYFIDHIERLFGLFGFVSRGVIAFTDVIYTCYLNSRATTRKQQVRTVKVKIVGFMIVSCYR